MTRDGRHHTRYFMFELNARPTVDQQTTMHSVLQFERNRVRIISHNVYEEERRAPTFDKLLKIISADTNSPGSFRSEYPHTQTFLFHTLECNDSIASKTSDDIRRKCNVSRSVGCVIYFFRMRRYKRDLNGTDNFITMRVRVQLRK